MRWRLRASGKPSCDSHTVKHYAALGAACGECRRRELEREPTQGLAPAGHKRLLEGGEALAECGGGGLLGYERVALLLDHVLGGLAHELLVAELALAALDVGLDAL